MKTKIYILVCILLNFSVVFAQEVKNHDKKISETSNDKKAQEMLRTNQLNATESTGDEINFKDDGDNSLITITDEGTTGSITLPPGGELTTGTANKLYNKAGSLYFGTTQLGSGGGGATELNDLSDAIYDGTNLFLGSNAGINNNGTNNKNTAVGKFALGTNDDGMQNTAIGYEALFNNSYGSGNTAMGRSALFNARGNYNVGIGDGVGLWNQGSNNTLIGYNAGGAGTTVFTGGGNVFIGYAAGYNETGNNKLYIENSSSSSPLIWGDFTNGSEKIQINGDFHVTGDITTDGSLLSDNDWDVDGNFINLNNISGYVGIGTFTSVDILAKLHVKGNDGVLFQGTHGSGTALNLGAGSRTHWYSKKSAFRSGYVDGTQWDDANIGTYSVAFGQNNIASGDRSSAFGENTTALGTNSVALGRGTNADASASLVLGRFNVGGGTAGNWISGDPVFEIGMGTGDLSRENAVTVLKNGNVGIGSSSPVSKLSVGDNGNISATLSSVSTASSGFGTYSLASGSGGRGVFGYASNTGSTTNYGGYFSSNGTTGRGVYGLAFGADGYGVYGSAPKYGVYGNASNTGSTVNYGGYFVAGSQTGVGVYGRCNNATGTNYGGVFIADGNFGRGASGYGNQYDFYADGPGVDYGSSSSRRWKSNIELIDNPLNKVNSLRGVYFDWDEEHGGKHDFGMIAEEVGEVLPEIVQYEQNGIDAIGMDYSKLTPLLVEAVKELCKKNEELMNRIETLEQKLTNTKFSNVSE